MLLPLLVWSHPTLSPVNPCAFLIFQCTHAWVCVPVKTRNVIPCSIWTKPTRSHPSKGKKIFPLTQAMPLATSSLFVVGLFWFVFVFLVGGAGGGHFCFSYKHLWVFCICINQHENLGAQWQQSCQYLTDRWLLSLLFSSHWVTLSNTSKLLSFRSFKSLWQTNAWIR